MESIINQTICQCKKFDEVEKLFENYAEIKNLLKGHKFEGFFERDPILAMYRDNLRNISIKIINNLTTILRSDQKITDSRLVSRVCEIVDKVGKSRGTLDTIYERIQYEKNGEFLISFLKELAIRGCISQVDKIFKSDCGLVGWFYKCDRGKEVFNLFPKDYQDRLSSGEVCLGAFYGSIGFNNSSDE